MRRLTRSQLDHTLRDLFGTESSPASALSPDESIGPFYSNAIAPVTDLLVQQHDEIALSVAAANAGRRNELAGCDLDLDDGGACVGAFIDAFGLKIHRRPLLPAERDEYRALYDSERVERGTASAFELLLSTWLASPFFLYHSDVGTSGAPTATATPLTSHELASRLSYFLWDTLPDARAFELAAADALQDEAVLSAEVERLLADPKAASAISSFHLQWLGLRDLLGVQKDDSAFPSFDAALLQAMHAETARFTDFVVRRGDGLMNTLFTAGFSFAEGPLFRLYGLSEPPNFVPGTQVALDPTQRSGLLTQAAFLTMHAHRDQTSPVHRGIVVRENLLCQALSPPPANVNTSLPPPDPATTTRERFVQHEADPVCGGCHVLIDPIGLAFENYDGIGAFRTTENGRPIDVSGEVLAAGADLEGAFDGVIELQKKLAQSRTVQDCLVNQWFRFALGRMESADDACSLGSVRESFRASGGNVRALLTELVKSRPFRSVRAQGVTP